MSDVQEWLRKIAGNIVEEKITGRDREKSPILLFMVGAPGAGKSTFIQSIANHTFLTNRSLSDCINESLMDQKFPKVLDHSHPLQQALIIDPGSFRIQIATTYASEKGIPLSQDRNAMRQLKEINVEVTDLIHQTGTYIAESLLIRCINLGISCVMDSTGNSSLGSDGKPTKYAIDIVRSLSESESKAYFFHLEVDIETARSRFEISEKGGHVTKYFFNEEIVSKGIERSTQIMTTFIEESSKHGGGEYNFLHIKPRLRSY